MCLLKQDGKCKGSKHYNQQCDRFREFFCKEKARLEKSLRDPKKRFVVEQDYENPNIGI